MDDGDFALALSLQDRFDREAKKKETVTRRHGDPKTIVDASWELVDPTPNIHQLFVDFDSMFFSGKLTNAGVEVKWSPKMTLCAGMCVYEGHGGLCSVRLSMPLLKLRPRKDLVETLLHEMIHAYLFVTARNTDHDGHGPQFLSHMNRINGLTGANITIYHSFHNEVNMYRQHWWQCDGPCKNRRPFFGKVKRAMNRAPSPKDPWWAEHHRTCGGTFHKIKEPEATPKGAPSSSKGKQSHKTASVGSTNIKDFFPSSSSEAGSSSSASFGSTSSRKFVTPFAKEGHRLSGGAESIKCMRQKLAEAAEKRMKDYTYRGIQRKPSLSAGGKKRDSVPGGSTAYDKRSLASKRPRPLPSDSDDESDCLLIPEGDEVLFVSLKTDTGAPNASTAAQETSTNTTIDLTAEDDDADPKFKTCPVCGLRDIPTPIINCHIAQCIAELEESDYD